ncbi:hypothetical protein [Sulfitobacter donghicola]|uniref:Uncharacterized protein n=1 Tax=Sulfitobacter donghicola DSW-25 = KCTC 12864 = JCM 14565 TaxID=1300350 RepID=A0A073IKK1_9RHOB|nr:hypothetical protein [Sulfitobacter donghicola]KEJ90299.1 hypothetical protein DSW25_05810 [Sulfitobacter donghicola DSW-25 = KCTC 12864 = JCM 14565]KIN67164.1 hypothetical protein Z948_870 [Sulfitobacter donghicola DSW-25 = KCTC 12864 = JCM 14565]
MRKSFFRSACAILGGNLLVAATATYAMSATVDQIMEQCRTGHMANLTEISPRDLTQAEATPLVLSLDNVTKMGQTLSQSASAADWSMDETIVAAFAQQTEMLRTGAVSGDLLRSERGVLYRWKDNSLGTLCILALPAATRPDAPHISPHVGTDSISWRAAPTGENAKFTSQIVMISDRPT